MSCFFLSPFWQARQHPRLHIPLESGKTRWHHLITQYTTVVFPFI
jgi:hypothetical protein